MNRLVTRSQVKVEPNEREQSKMNTAEESQFLPPRTKKKTNEQHHYENNGNKRENLDLEYVEMLSPKLWEKVFRQVQDPLDFQALINSSATWRKLLEKERTKFLFALVFPILLKNKLIDYNRFGDFFQPQVDPEQRDEATSRSKVTKAFKDYRAVCKTWDRGIQDYVQRYYRHAFLSSMKMSAEMGAVNEKFEDDDPRINGNFNYIREIEHYSGLDANYYLFFTPVRVDKFFNNFNFGYQQFNEAVNEKFENDDPRINDNYNYIAELERRISAKQYVFPTAEKLDIFLNKFNFAYQQFNSNPILTRCVVISDFHLYMTDHERVNCLGEPDPAPFQNDPGAGFHRCSKFLLEQFGEHIHYLTLELGHLYSSNLIEFRSIVYDWLKHVPNLKGLILKYRADDRQKLQYHHQEYPEAVPVPEAYNGNQNQVLQVFPKLAHLQFLEVYNVPGAIFDDIVSKAPSLSKVSIQLIGQGKASYGDYFNSDSTYGDEPQRPLFLNMNIRSRDDLLNLESSLENGISMKIETLCIRFYHEMKMTEWGWWDRQDRWNRQVSRDQETRYDRHFEFGYKAGWNNREFHDWDAYGIEGTSEFFYVPENDHVYPSESDDWPEWNRLFRVVELLGAESLLKLSIRLPAFNDGVSSRILSECPDLRLNLVKLKSLVIQIPNTTSIDFLLGMKNTLEEATLILTNPTAVMSYRLKEQIKFNGYFHIMMSSNIWSEMPKLKNLTLRVAQKNKKAGANRVAQNPSSNLKEYNYERSS